MKENKSLNDDDDDADEEVMMMMMMNVFLKVNEVKLNDEVKMNQIENEDDCD